MLVYKIKCLTLQCSIKQVKQFEIMKAIVVNMSDFNNPKFKRVFSIIVNLSGFAPCCKKNGLVYIFFSNETDLTACSSSLFVGSILHRVTLI